MDRSSATLVIMAAGIGSRFGGGIKQLESVGPNGELIIDYSIRDALAAGFDKVVFIIRKEIEDDFRRIIGDRTEELTRVSYAFQELTDIPEKYAYLLEGRTKPWGTGAAILACADIVNEPFCVINADDYYGEDAFKKIYGFLTEEKSEEDGVLALGMAGYRLSNTLSDYGSVTRGVCEVDENGYLSHIEETFEIVRTESGAGIRKEDGSIEPIDADAAVSMNMWALVPAFFQPLAEGFDTFLSGLTAEDKKAEYLLPNFIGSLVSEGRASVKVLRTEGQWFGVTYKEDKPLVREKIRKIMEEKQRHE